MEVRTQFRRPGIGGVVAVVRVSDQTASEEARQLRSRRVCAGFEAIDRLNVMIDINAIESRETVRFDRAHFQKYGDFALIFEAVYYVLSSDYPTYMDIQQAINLEIYDRFEQDGIATPMFSRSRTTEPWRKRGRCSSCRCMIK